MKEAVLEPLLRRMRINKVLPIIRKYPSCRLLDVGCGWNARFLKTVEPFIECGVGIDGKAPEIQDGKIKTQRAVFDESLPFESGSFDVVTMLAVLEHLAHSEKIINEIDRVLTPNGRLVLTVPSRAAKPVLEFLAYQLKVVSSEEIRDHKRYYNVEDLLLAFGQSNLKMEKHNYFQFGMNNFCVFHK